MSAPTLQDYRAWFGHHRPNIFQDYFTLLRFPSISTDPTHKKDVRACAEWLKTFLEKSGLQVELWETSKNPVLFATCMKAGPSKPTLMIYNHYDVQPVDPLNLWKSPPFEPTLRDNKVYARGASDNKGQLSYVLFAVRAYLELAKTHNFNLKMFIEGEEECGSEGGKEVLKTKKEQLKTDYCLIVDAGLPKHDVPAVSLGVRGLVAMTVTVRNSNVDLHSGIFGGIVLNPLQVLCTALANLWQNGKIAVPGIYDDVVEFSDKDWEEFTQDFEIEEAKKTFGIRAFGGEAGYSLNASNWIRPTLEINGLSGGYTGEGFKTVIPAEAQAKISCRLVPNQNPEKVAKQIGDFLKDQLPKGFECKIDLHSTGHPMRTSSKTPIVQFAKKAYEEVFARPCQFSLSGGSIDIVAEIAKATGAAIALMGTATDEDDIHAPNEHFSLEQFERGFLTVSRTLSLIAEK